MSARADQCRTSVPLSLPCSCSSASAASSLVSALTRSRAGAGCGAAFGVPPGGSGLAAAAAGAAAAAPVVMGSGRRAAARAAMRPGGCFRTGCCCGTVTRMKCRCGQVAQRALRILQVVCGKRARRVLPNFHERRSDLRQQQQERSKLLLSWAHAQEKFHISTSWGTKRGKTVPEDTQ